MSYWYPRAMREAPQLDDAACAASVRPRYALLINPFYPKAPHASFGKHVLTPTLALTSVAGATPPTWKIRCWDENLLQGPPPNRPMPQVVGITAHLTFARRAFELARWYRQRGSKVVLGGLHVQACADECAAHADAVAIGEGTQLWPQILADVANGTLRDRYEGCYTRPYEDSPIPRRDLLPRGQYLTTASLIATRGCRNRCDFCHLATYNLRMPYQARDVDQVAAEFKATGQPYGVFTDNNLGADPRYMKALCRALRPLEKIWSAAVTIDVADDPSLIKEMALAGCTGVFVGFESLRDENLDQSGKRGTRVSGYADRVKRFHDNGIQVNGSFVFGFDGDRPDVFEETVEWVEANRLECATFHILTPYPGTPLFKRFESEGRLLHRDWTKYDTANVVFRPLHMTPKELHEGYVWCYERVFSMRSIWARRPMDPSAIPGYLAMSLLYKRANWLWPFLIQHRLTHAAWRPLVELSRRRHVGFRKRLASRKHDAIAGAEEAFGSV